MLFSTKKNLPYNTSSAPDTRQAKLATSWWTQRSLSRVQRPINSFGVCGELKGERYAGYLKLKKTLLTVGDDMAVLWLQLVSAVPKLLQLFASLHVEITDIMLYLKSTLSYTCSTWPKGHESWKGFSELAASMRIYLILSRRRSGLLSNLSSC